MAEFPTYEQMAKNVAEKALDEILYDGKSIREWMKIIIEQDSCENCISRQEVMDALCNDCELYKNGEQTCFSKCEEYHFLVTLPSVRPEKKTGHWIYDNIANNWRCDKCGETPKTMGYVGTADFMREHFKFCNHCGCRMSEVSE